MGGIATRFILPIESLGEFLRGSRLPVMPYDGMTIHFPRPGGRGDLSLSVDGAPELMLLDSEINEPSLLVWLKASEPFYDGQADQLRLAAIEAGFMRLTT